MDTWDFMQNWSFVLPPSRPSANQLQEILTISERIDRNAPVAILGSTPEFRDLLFEAGFQSIYVFDKNVKFFEAMSGIRIHSNQESMIRGDWLDSIASFKNQFALILSDLTSGNLPYDKRPDFYSIISDALISKGIFYDKVLTHTERNLRFQDLVSKYSMLPLNLLYINYFSSEMLFCSELLDINQTVDTTLFYSILYDRVTNQRIRAFTDQAKLKITPENCLWYYGRKWDVLRKDYCPNLKLLSEYIEDDETNPYFGRLRFFAMQKR